MERIIFYAHPKPICGPQKTANNVLFHYCTTQWKVPFNLMQGTVLWLADCQVGRGSFFLRNYSAPTMSILWHLDDNEFIRHRGPQQINTLTQCDPALWFVFPLLCSFTQQKFTNSTKVFAPHLFEVIRPDMSEFPFQNWNHFHIKFPQIIKIRSINFLRSNFP